MANPAPDKATARAVLLRARAERMPEPDEDARRTAALLALAEPGTTVAAYVSFGTEPSTLGALDGWRRSGVRVLLPVVLPDRDLEFRVYDGALVPGRLGASTPPPDAPVADLGEAAVVVVPALAADRTGGRLGRGAGSYDRALARLSDDTLTVAVVHPEELWPVVPTEDHDRRVRAVLAGHELVRCR